MYISVAELKRSIVEKKGLSRDHAAELMLSEAETGRGSRRAPRAGCPMKRALTLRSSHRACPACAVRFRHGAAEWNDDSELIQKNTSIIVRRVPGQKPKTLTAPEPALPGYAASYRIVARRPLTPQRSCSAVPEKRERVIAVRPTYASKCVLRFLLWSAAYLTRTCTASARGRTGRFRRRKRRLLRRPRRCFTRCVLLCNFWPPPRARPHQCCTSRREMSLVATCWALLQARRTRRMQPSLTWSPPQQMIGSGKRTSWLSHCLRF